MCDRRDECGNFGQLRHCKLVTVSGGCVMFKSNEAVWTFKRDEPAEPNCGIRLYNIPRQRDEARQYEPPITVTREGVIRAHGQEVQAQFEGGATYWFFLKDENISYSKHLPEAPYRLLGILTTGKGGGVQQYRLAIRPDRIM